MKTEHMVLLTTNEFFVLKSAKTNDFYLDREYAVFFFISPREAKNLTEQVKDTYVSELMKFKQSELLVKAATMGVKTIMVKKSQDKDFIKIPFSETEAPKNWYNSDSKRCVLRLKQTDKLKYLKDMKDLTFICPLHIPERQIKEYPKLRYGIGKTKSGKIFYILFSSIAEFEYWVKLQKETYSSLKTELSGFNKITGGNPIIINPLSDKLILTDKMLQNIQV